MKVFISFDMEGVAGIVYEDGRRRLHGQATYRRADGNHRR